MRKNIFLHFLNRDTREIFDLFDVMSKVDHSRLMRQSLNASILLCEDHCVMPPGFILEEQIAFNLSEAQGAFLESERIKLPLRERSLAELAEKKRSDYKPMRNRYTGLFDDTRIEFLAQRATGLIRRKSHITKGIADAWVSGPDADPIWAPIKNQLKSAEVQATSEIPNRLFNQQSAATWSAIKPQLEEEATGVGPQIRDVLQHTYFRQYCQEFGLVALCDIPRLVHTFELPTQILSYSFSRLSEFLRAFELDNLLLDADAEFLVRLKNGSALVDFMDSYVQLAEKSKSQTDLFRAASHVSDSGCFEWSKFVTRTNILLHPPTDLEISELESALSDTAHNINQEHGFATRTGKDNPSAAADRATQLRGKTMADLVIFVALQEELNILCDELKFGKNDRQPLGAGVIDGLDVDVVCPNDMGRVAAAVEMSEYLSSRKRQLPKQIIIVGLAGGFIEQGVSAGQILCVSTVTDLALRKITDEKEKAKTKFRQRDYALGNKLDDLLNSDHFDTKAWSDEALKRYDWPKDKRPSIEAGMVVSADEVVASEDWKKQILDHAEKALGVEMEAGGVCAAASKYSVPVSMLRVVSDYADPSKADDLWRKRGMQTLSLLLAKLPISRLLK